MVPNFFPNVGGKPPQPPFLRFMRFFSLPSLYRNVTFRSIVKFGIGKAICFVVASFFFDNATTTRNAAPNKFSVPTSWNEKYYFVSSLMFLPFALSIPKYNLATTYSICFSNSQLTLRVELISEAVRIGLPPQCLSLLRFFCAVVLRLFLLF